MRKGWRSDRRQNNNDHNNDDDNVSLGFLLAGECLWVINVEAHAANCRMAKLIIIKIIRNALILYISDKALWIVSCLSFIFGINSTCGRHPLLILIAVWERSLLCSSENLCVCRDGNMSDRLYRGVWTRVTKLHQWKSLSPLHLYSRRNKDSKITQQGGGLLEVFNCWRTFIRETSNPQTRHHPWLLPVHAPNLHPTGTWTPPHTLNIYYILD